MRKTLCGISADRTSARRDTVPPKTRMGISPCVNVHKPILSEVKEATRKYGIINQS